MAAGPGCGRGDDGVGVLGTVIGMLMFLVSLLFAAQILLGLYTTSLVTAAAFDAAKLAAGAGARADVEGARAAAEATARRLLGPTGQRARFTWSDDADSVVLRVQAPRPSLLGERVVGPIGLGDIDRTVRVRIERLR